MNIRKRMSFHKPSGHASEVLKQKLQNAVAAYSKAIEIGAVASNMTINEFLIFSNFDINVRNSCD